MIISFAGGAVGRLGVHVDPGEAPAWVETAIANGWLVGEWLNISGDTPTAGYGLTATNTMADAKGSNPSGFANAFIHAWNGGALASGHRDYGMYILGPGGAHNEYGTCDMYGFDLETRTWEQLSPGGTGGFDTDTAFGEFADGHPVTNHTAAWLTYDANRNELVIPRGWGSPTSGSDQFPKPYGHGFDLSDYDANGYNVSQWRRFPELTGFTTDASLTDLAQQCCATYDANRDKVWIAACSNSGNGQGVLASYDSAGDAWTFHAAIAGVFLGSNMALDPVRDLLVILAPPWFGDDELYIVDPDSPDTRSSGANPYTATQTPPAGHGGAGWEWSDALNGFVFYSWSEGATVRLAEYASGGLADYTVTWSTLTAESNAVTPDAQVSGGAYNRFRLAKWGSREVALFTSDVDNSVHAFRVN